MVRGQVTWVKARSPGWDWGDGILCSCSLSLLFPFFSLELYLELACDKYTLCQAILMYVHDTVRSRPLKGYSRTKIMKLCVYVV